MNIIASFMVCQVVTFGVSPLLLRRLRGESEPRETLKYFSKKMDNGLMTGWVTKLEVVLLLSGPVLLVREDLIRFTQYWFVDGSVLQMADRKGEST